MGQNKLNVVQKEKRNDFNCSKYIFGHKINLEKYRKYFNM